jgi:hypothetical protein
VVVQKKSLGYRLMVVQNFGIIDLCSTEVEIIGLWSV